MGGPWLCQVPDLWLALPSRFVVATLLGNLVLRMRSPGIWSWLHDSQSAALQGSVSLGALSETIRAPVVLGLDRARFCVGQEAAPTLSFRQAATLLSL